MTSFVDVKKNTTAVRGFVYMMLCVFGGSLFLALMSQFSINLWFTPVPITLQTLGVMLIGALLGSKNGALAVLMYLGEGVMGFPVFTNGCSGIAYLCGPTGGYLFAFVATAFVIGFLLERGWKNNYFLTLTALIIGSALTLGFGALWLSLFVGGKNAVALGVTPFLIGCAVKVFTASAMIPSGRKALNLLKGL